MAINASVASCSRVQCIIGCKGVGVPTCSGQGGSGYTTGSAQCSVYGTVRYSAVQCSSVWGWISLNAVLVGQLGMREQGLRSANHLLHHNEEGDIRREKENNKKN